jgi:hypothetical protein
MNNIILVILIITLISLVSYNNEYFIGCSQPLDNLNKCNDNESTNISNNSANTSNNSTNNSKSIDDTLNLFNQYQLYILVSIIAYSFCMCSLCCCSFILLKK